MPITLRKAVARAQVSPRSVVEYATEKKGCRVKSEKWKRHPSATIIVEVVEQTRTTWTSCVYRSNPTINHDRDGRGQNIGMLSVTAVATGECARGEWTVIDRGHAMARDDDLICLGVAVRASRVGSALFASTEGVSDGPGVRPPHKTDGVRRDSTTR